MKIATYKQLRFVCMISVAASFGLTGCKSPGSWKMPTMSWNREPSATTLAGSETPKLPESPANKYSPSTIASVGAGTSPGTTPGNKAPSYGYAGQTSPTTAATSTGLAATANGYQNGAPEFGQKSATSTQPSTGSAGAMATSLPNPYGGTYGGVNATNPADIALSNSVKGALATYPAPNASTGYGTTTPPANSAYTGTSSTLPPLPGAPAPTSFGTASISSNPYQNLPPLPGASTGLGSTVQTSLPAAPSFPPTYGNTQSYPGTSAYANATPAPGTSGTLPAFPAAGTQPSGTQALGTQPSATHTPGSTYALESTPPNRYSGSYQPGTTARSTTYSFGGVTPAAATAPQSITLPPNTASGAGPGLPSSNVIR